MQKKTPLTLQSEELNYFDFIFQKITLTYLFLQL